MDPTRPPFVPPPHPRVSQPLDPTSPAFIPPPHLSYPTEHAVHQGIKALSTYSGVEAWARTVIDSLRAKGLPRLALVGERHGRLGGLTASLAAMAVLSQSPGPKLLLMEFNHRDLVHAGLADPDSPVVRQVQANLQSGRPPLRGVRLQVDSSRLSDDELADLMNAYVTASTAHLLGFEVRGFDPLQDPSRSSLEDDFLAARDAGMRECIEAALAVPDSVVLAVGGNAHVGPMHAAMAGFVRTWAACALPHGVWPTGTPAVTQRFSYLLAKSADILVQRAADAQADRIATLEDLHALGAMEAYAVEGIDPRA